MPKVKPEETRDAMDVIRDSAAKAADRKAVLAEVIADISAAIPSLKRATLGDMEAGEVPGLVSIERACARVRASLA